MRWIGFLIVGSTACGDTAGRGTTTAWDPTVAGDSGSDDSGGVDTQADPGESSDDGVGESTDGPRPSTDDGASSDDGGEVCLAPTDPCPEVGGEGCCDGYVCGNTSLGQVCCGEEGAPCATANGEDCCGDLLCVDGVCGYQLENTCDSPCTAAPALTLEKQRLANIGGSFLGICGDANHTYGFHVPAANLPADDYSMEGPLNVPVCEWHAAAIDIGMDWPASREWLMWLIQQIQTDQITGIAEVIGSYDGVDVRYWSDSAGWSTEGIPYTGSGHDTWTHVSIYRSTTLEDHHILWGWDANGGP